MKHELNNQEKEKIQNQALLDMFEKYFYTKEYVLAAWNEYNELEPANDETFYVEVYQRTKKIHVTTINKPSSIQEEILKFAKKWEAAGFPLPSETKSDFFDSLNKKNYLSES